jgi:hypothetical protein
MKPHPLRRLAAWVIGMCKLFMAKSAARRAEEAVRLDRLARRVLRPGRQYKRREGNPPLSSPEKGGQA